MPQTSPPLAAPTSLAAIWDMEDAHCTLLVADVAGHPKCNALHYLQPGLQLISRRLFRNRPPQPKHIEQAILMVEGMLAPTAQLLPTATRLLCAHPLVHDIAARAAAGNASHRAHSELRLTCAEALLQRRLDQDPSLPQHAPWTAALVLAYEVMAQWEIDAIHVVPALAH